MLLGAIVLGGCSTSLSEMQIGSGSEVKPEPTAYLPVNALPPARDQAAMEPAERDKMQKDLIATRDRQASAAKEQGKDQPLTQNQAQK